MSGFYSKIKAATRWLCLGSALFLCACTQAGFDVLNLPTSLDNGTVIHDVAYGDAPEQKLDIYLPNNAGQTPHDVIVFFYGGRWTTGAKEDYRFVGTTLAQQGFVVFIPDYRKYPQVRFPVFVQDGAKALAWVYNNIGTYHGARDKINVAGHSAGAHIGALLAANPHYLADEGLRRSDVVHSFAGLAGPYDFTPDEPDLIDMFAPPSHYPLMQVTTFIDGKQPPMLLLYGASDTDVKLYNLENLQQRIKDKGGYVSSAIYPDTDHIDILLGLSWLRSDDAPVRDDMVKFFHSADQTTQ